MTWQEQPVAVAGVGLATAQGGAGDVWQAAAPRGPEPLPWPPHPSWSCRRCRPATAVAGRQLRGAQRWSALAAAALADLGPPPPDVPLLVASCNGGADGLDDAGWRRAFDAETLLRGTPSAGRTVSGRTAAVVSGSCASGLQALWLGRLLLAAGAPEVVVLAAEILSPASHDNFEGLRVLAEEAAPPWTRHAIGFLPGEAAVALRLARGGGGVPLAGPVLTQDLREGDGLRRALQALPNAGSAARALALGTGPAAVDAVELAALAAALPATTPIGSALPTCGHTLGASGLLSLALAAEVERTGRVPPLLSGAGQAADGRALLSGGAARPGGSLVACRALGGACAVAGAGLAATPVLTSSYEAPAERTPLGHPLLRRLADAADAARPPRPPDLLLVDLEVPLLPPERARIGGRLLPTAVLEMTPGALPLLIARRWGYTGPAICRVGPAATDEVLNAAAALGLKVRRLAVRGEGEARDLVW